MRYALRGREKRPLFMLQRRLPLFLLSMILVAGTQCFIVGSAAVRFGGRTYLDGVESTVVFIIGVVNAA